MFLIPDVGVDACCSVCIYLFVCVFMCVLYSYTVWNALVCAGIITGVAPILVRFPGLSFAELGLGLLLGSGGLGTTWLYGGGTEGKFSGCPLSLRAATTGSRGLGPRGALLCTID